MATVASPPPHHHSYYQQQPPSSFYPSTPHSTSQSVNHLAESLLRQATEHSLHAFLEPNAIFLAERLHAQFPSASSRNLLATAYLRHGLYSLSADTLRPSLSTTPENRYLYAVCHFRINTDLSLREAESILTPSATDNNVPGGAAGIFLLASIYQRMGRRDDAVTMYRKAVRECPLMWCAFERLSAMGVVSAADTVFPNVSDMNALQLVREQPSFHPGFIDGESSFTPTSIVTAPISIITQQQVNSTSQGGNFTPMTTPAHLTSTSQAHANFPSAAATAAPRKATAGIGRRSVGELNMNMGTSSRPITRAAAAAARASVGGADDAVTGAMFVTPSPIPPRHSQRSYGGHGGNGAGGGGGAGTGIGGDVVTPVGVGMAGLGMGLGFGMGMSGSGRSQTPRRLPRRSMSPSSLQGLRVGRRIRGVLLDDSSVRNPTDLFSTPPPSHPQQRHPSNSTASASVVSTTAVKTAATTTAHHHLPHPSQPPPHHQHQHQHHHHHHHHQYQQQQDNINSNSALAMNLIRSLGQIFAELGRFRCTRAIELTNLLPTCHRQTGLILSLRGRAYLDKADYSTAAGEFRKCLHLEPSRIDGVADYFSTVLWQLKRDRELAQLAIRAMQVYPISSSAWCAAGNCFSLQHDADTALRHFSRAVCQGGANEAYARTLCGHEFLGKEDFDRAIACYRAALQADDRMYAAMYGIGQVLLKQEKFTLAQSHLRNAVHINPRNSVLHYHLGVALAAGVVNSNNNNENGGGGNGGGGNGGKRQMLMAALVELETAGNLDMKNPVPRFERAKILGSLGRVAEARKQLEDLRDRLPKEAEVHFELGRVCHRMGDRKQALAALSAAFDIEPKERKYKKALESLSNELESSGAN